MTRSDDGTRRPRIRVLTRGSVRRLAALFVILMVALITAYRLMIPMPGESHTGPLPPLDADGRALAADLARDVEHLAETIGVRNTVRRTGLDDAATWIEASLNAAGYAAARQDFEVHRSRRDRQPIPCANVLAERSGRTRASEIIVIGAHYDSFNISPGANDNASGVAATLALARRFADRQSARTIRFVLFANEEPPLFQTAQMGSLVYARACRARNDDVVAMLSIETIGYYDDAEGSQDYPAPLNAFYPSTGDFIGFVSNVDSRHLNRALVRSFRENAAFPSEGASPYGGLPGVGWSDHWAFWQCDYPGVMVTDTAPFRYPHYHEPTDTPDKLDYERMARVVLGLEAVILELANPAP